MAMDVTVSPVGGQPSSLKLGEAPSLLDTGDFQSPLAKDMEPMQSESSGRGATTLDAAPGRESTASGELLARVARATERNRRLRETSRNLQETCTQVLSELREARLRRRS